MFGWFKKRPMPLLPESRWSVALEADTVCVTDDVGQIKSVARTDLSGVAIETNDSGPWGADVWWLLFGANDELACTYPQGATGEQAVMEFLTTLPAFDHVEMGKAMCSTGNARLPHLAAVPLVFRLQTLAGCVAALIAVVALVAPCQAQTAFRRPPG